MAEKSPITPLCHIHPDDVAQALCKNHKKLLCFSCALDKAKSPECSITELKRISGEQESTLYECLLTKQIALDKKRLIDVHENKTEALKNDLDQQAIDLHTKLVTRLNEMKEYCLKSIDTQAKAVIARNDDSKKKLDTIEREMTETFDKLSAESIDYWDIQKQLKEIKTKLLDEVPDQEAVPEGKFQPSKKLENFILQSGYTLGKVYLICADRYALIDDPGKLPETIEGNEEDDEEIGTDGDNFSSDKRKLIIYAASDEIADGNEKTDESQESCKVKQTTESIGSPTTKQENTVNSKQTQVQESKTNRMSQDEKGAKKVGGLFKGLFARKKSSGQEKEAAEASGKDDKSSPTKSRSSSELSKNVTENIYKESDFAISKHAQPKYLINKTATIVDIRKYFSSPCKFSKLVCVGGKSIGLLSRVHNSVLLTSADGKEPTKKSLPGLTNFAAVGKEEIATIVEKGLQVTRFKISDRKFSTAHSFIVNEDISNITGFDFDESSSQFAVSSPGKVIILDKSGKKVKVTPYETGTSTASNDVVTTYDFNTDCIYVLNGQNKTLKCFSLAQATPLWKRKCGSELFRPSDLCLYQDKLCISCGDSIAIFNAKEGTPVVKHDTNDLLDACYGLCVVDDVIVFSSKSDDFDTSAKLAYISV